MPDNKFTLEGVSDDFLNSRFDPELREKFFDRFKSSQRPVNMLDVPVSFHGKFTESFSGSLKTMFNTLFQFASDIRIDVKQYDMSIAIFDEPTWRRTKTAAKMKVSRLPALKTVEHSGRAKFMLILNGDESSGTDVINVARLLFSKIFGEMFFSEVIEKSAPFSDILKTEPKNFQTPVEEKIAIGRLFIQESPVLKSCWLKLGQKNRLTGNSAEKYGRRLFYGLIEEVGPETPDYLAILSSQTKAFEESPEKFMPDTGLDGLIDTIIAKSRIFHFILPHERAQFNGLRKSSRSVFFQLMAEKIEHLRSVFDSLTAPQPSWNEETVDIEADKQLKKAPAKGEQDLAKIGPKDRQEAEAPEIAASFYYSIMSGLVRRKLAHDFLRPEELKSESHLRKARVFPLSVIATLRKDMNESPTKEIIERAIDIYTNSASQRAYNLACIKSHLQQAKDAGKEKLENLAKINEQWYKIRLEHLNDLNFICRFLERHCRGMNPRRERIMNSLQVARSGWAYFISFALVDCYFAYFHKDKEDRGEKRAKFKNIIIEHIKQNLKDTPYFCVSQMLLMLYSMLEGNIGKVVKAFSHKCPALVAYFQEGIYMRQPPTTEYSQKIAKAICKWLADFEETEQVNEAASRQTHPHRIKLLG